MWIFLFKIKRHFLYYLILIVQAVNEKYRKKLSAIKWDAWKQIMQKVAGSMTVLNSD